MNDPKLTDFSVEELQELLTAIVQRQRDKEEDLTANKKIWKENGFEYPKENEYAVILTRLSMLRTQILNAQYIVKRREQIQSN